MAHALPGALALTGFFLVTVLAFQTPWAISLSLLGLFMWGYSIVYLGAEADYWEARYRREKGL